MIKNSGIASILCGCGVLIRLEYGTSTRCPYCGDKHCVRKYNAPKRHTSSRSSPEKLAKGMTLHPSRRGQAMLVVTKE